MAHHLGDLFRVGTARNLFIHGPPGTGKTVCVMHVLSEVDKHARETNKPVQSVYVNAGKTRNPYYTMAEIVKQLGVVVPFAGWQMFRFKHAFEDRLTKKSLLIAIDEVDSILYKEKEPLVYYLNRQPRTTLILISNNIDDVINLPQRALSTLQPILIPMQAYTTREALQILKERTERACNPNTIPDQLLTAIAKTTSDNGDIRFGLRVLLAAAQQADTEQKTAIDAQDVKSAVKQENRIRKLQEFETLKDQVIQLTKKYQSI